MKQIYIHGLGQTPDDWKEVLHRLNSEKDGVCPDLPGMASAGQATYTDLYSAFARFCSRIEGPLSLCGLSLGGVLALHYAAEHPEQVDRLVLIAPQYRMPKRLLQAQNLLFRCMPRSLFRQMGFSKDQFIQLCKSMEELDFSGVALPHFLPGAGAVRKPRPCQQTGLPRVVAAAGPCGTVHRGRSGA